ncbi:MAG: hypothetical protein EXS63_09420 [Candidatus Omnitrophica bacterium]|nr:hypothetical protein [Candidatus Omnitrophota bacterium]
MTSLRGVQRTTKQSLSPVFLAIFLWLVISPCAHAAYEAYYPATEKQNSLQLMGRGLGNFAGSPLEISSTLVREYRTHPRLWPATYPFRLAQNFIFRVCSSVNDGMILPWVASIAHETPPLTRGLGLPDYPWNIE